MRPTRLSPHPAEPAAPCPPPAGLEGASIAGRYRLLERLNERGESEVYRAWDTLTGGEVAIKLLPAGADRPQLRAEVAALRLLHLPGVARLLDEGLAGDRPFLALELVLGEPFPGGATGEPRTWESIRDQVVGLLEILARVHDRGVIHRDLKPDNVLVIPSGRPVVLDFGLSAGVAIGSGRDPDPRAVGTPAYAAPEQILGRPLDARADLYALGVMLYETLSGEHPQGLALPDELLQRRLGQEPLPLGRRTPEVPSTVARLVDDLLAREPERRPRSAADALRRLAGGAALGPDPELPWLGGARALDAAHAAVASGRPLELAGEAGSGRTRLLTELGQRLRASGREVLELGPSGEPLGGLGPLAPTAEQLGGVALEDVLELAHGRVLAALDAGLVILVDDSAQLDRWSRRVLDGLVAETATGPVRRGCLVRVVAASAPPSAALRMELSSLAEGDLRALFAGPERVFHLREDGARELWRRTEGQPGRVAAEVAAWVRAGLVRWSGPLLAIDRQALGRLAMGLDVTPPERSGDLAGQLSPGLEQHLAWVALAAGEVDGALLAAARGLPAWQVEAEQLELLEAGAVGRVPGAEGRLVARVHPQVLDGWSEQQRRDAHGRLADLLEGGTPGRLLHLISAGRPDEVPDEARVLAHHHLDRGRLAQAEAALVEGLAAVRSARGTGGAHADELGILEAWLAVALADFTPQALDRVLYELSRAGAEHLERFAHAALATLEHPGERALAELEALEPLADLELERWRHALLLQAGRGASASREAELLERCAAWCRAHDTPTTRASLAEWTGRLLYRQDRPLEAAEQFETAARLSQRVTPRLSATLNGASALLEAGEPERASAQAQAALELAARCRHELFEVRAEWILRATAYRRGSTDGPDLELVQAAGRVGVPDQEALIALTEAAVAWRERHPAAAELAGRAVELWAGLGKTWATVLASSLALASAGPGSARAATLSEELAELAERAGECPDPLLAGQSLALLVRAGATPSPACARVAARLRAEVPAAEHRRRRDVLSVAEVLAALE